MTITDDDWQAIVVGSGIGGLTTAAYLAATGTKTLLLEHYSVVGGSSHVFRRREYEFEVGLHYVGDCGHDGNVPTILNGVGLQDRIEWLAMDSDGYDTLVFPDLTFKVPYGWDNYLDNLLEAFPEDRRAITAVVAVMRRLSSATDRGTTPGSLRGTARMAAKAGSATVWAMQPLSRLFDHHKLSAPARAVIGAQWGQHGCPPKRAPVALHAGLLHNYIDSGAYFPGGGSQTIAAHLAQVIVANGGQIRTSATVESIRVEGGRVAGVELAGGESISAPVVVSNADIKRTYLDLVGRHHLRRRTASRVENWRMSAPFVNMYLGLDVDLRESCPNSNFFSFPTAADNGDAYYDDFIDRAGEMPLDEWTEVARRAIGGFIHSSTLKDSTRRYAPEGHTSLEVMALAPADYRFWGVETGPAEGGKYRRGDRYLQTKELMTQLLTERLLAAIPQADGHIVWEETATPITQERYTRCTAGSAYGIECNTRQFGPLRPGSKTEVRGLFIAGSTTAWGPSIEGSMLSGIHAASAVVGRDLLTAVRSGSVFGNARGLPVNSDDWDALEASSNFGTRSARRHRNGSATTR